MKRAALFLLLAGVSLLSACALTWQSWNRMPERILQQVENAIWGVTDKCDRVVGTAFVVRHEGKKFLLTSEHVIHGYDLAGMKFTRKETPGGLSRLTLEELQGVRAVYVDDVLDVAVLTADNLESLPGLELSPWEEQRVRVFAIGLAQAQDYLGISITEGVVANPRKAVIRSRAFDQTHIEHTACLVGGQSGGPLVDMRGRAVGVDSFASGQAGLHLYYANPIRQTLEQMNALGRLEIKNDGTGRIKEIYVTPLGLEPAEIDKLPPRVGKINGMSSVRFGMPEGRYIVTLTTEEPEPVRKEIRIVRGKTETITYAYQVSGFRVFNAGCDQIQRLSVFPKLYLALLQAGLSTQTEGTPGEKTAKLLQMMVQADVMGDDTLAPGQMWVEYYPPGEIVMFPFNYDINAGQMKMPDQVEVTVREGQIQDVYVR